jgi:hypothetical protein
MRVPALRGEENVELAGDVEIMGPAFGENGPAQ